MRSLLLLLAGCATAASADPRMSAVAPLAGTWVAIDGDTRTEERWGAALAGAMFGTARTTRGEATLSFEFLRIELRGDRLVYVAAPRGGATTEFAHVAHPEFLVFENRAHDFPQRIRYLRRGDRLEVHIEGEGAAPMEWRFERVGD